MLSVDARQSDRTTALEDTSWTQLLFALLSQRFSGTVRLKQDGVERSVWLHGGFPVASDWELDGTGISQILAGAGVIDDATAARILEAAPLDSLDAWRFVVEESIVDQDTANLAARDQCERRIAPITGLRKGAVTICETSTLEGDVAASLSAARTLRVIQKAVREWCGPRRAEEEMSEISEATVRITSSYTKYRDRFGFDGADAAAISTLLEYGPFRFEDLASFSALDPVRGMQLLYTLWSCRMLVLSETDTQPSGVFPPVPAAGRASAAKEPAAKEPAAKQPAAKQPESKGQSEISLVIELLTSKIQAGADPLDVLALEPNANLAAIEASFEEIGRKVQREAEAMPGTRHRVEDLEASLKDVRSAARVRRGMAAKKLAAKALNERSFPRARQALSDLAELDGDNLEVLLDLAWAKWHCADQSERASRALAAAISNALEGDAKLGRAHYYRGCLLKHEDKTDGALRAFERAVEFDSSLLDAQREMRALRASSGSSERSTGSQKAKRNTGSSPRTKLNPKKKPAKSKGPRSKYWSGPWPMIWILSGSLLALMLVAQIVLRLDADF